MFQTGMLFWRRPSFPITKVHISTQMPRNHGVRVREVGHKGIFAPTFCIGEGRYEDVTEPIAGAVGGALESSGENSYGYGS
ncbi:unnamed protein product, partial [Iphiclides podalirius]